MRDHRSLAAKHDPSLPQRAGRALKKLNERLATEAAQCEAQKLTEARTAMPAKRKYRKNTDRVIRVRSVVHAQPNAEKFARALLELAKELAEKDRKERQNEKDAA